MTVQKKTLILSEGCFNLKLIWAVNELIKYVRSRWTCPNHSLVIWLHFVCSFYAINSFASELARSWNSQKKNLSNIALIKLFFCQGKNVYFAKVFAVWHWFQLEQNLFRWSFITFHAYHQLWMSSGISTET